jgi:nitric oxide dioxygenase
LFTDREIELVRATWDVADADPDAAAALFFGRLFEVAPELRPLFPDDTKAPGRRLMRMIGLTVDEMDRLARILPAVERCGHRHVAYGALPDHHRIFGEVLLETLAKIVGGGFTPEAKAAWTRTHAVLSSVMIDAQRASESAA